MYADPYKVNPTPAKIIESEPLSDFPANEDPMLEIYDRLNHKFNYRPEEQGIFHTTHHQGLKLRNNGSAELFTDEDTGIRLDPASQSINLFANHYKNHLANLTSWLTGSSAFYIEKDWTVKTKGKHVVFSGGDIEIETKKNLTIKIDKDDNITVKGNASLIVDGNVSAQIGGNMNAKVKQHATIDVKENLNLKSNHLSIEANSYKVPWMPHSHPEHALVNHTHPE